MCLTLRDLCLPMGLFSQSIGPISMEDVTCISQSPLMYYIVHIGLSYLLPGKILPNYAVLKYA